jgi:hypothetical protein
MDIKEDANYTLSILCWDLRHTLRRYRQGPFVEWTDYTSHGGPCDDGYEAQFKKQEFSWKTEYWLWLLCEESCEGF